MKKRIFSMLLAVILLVSLTAVTALAAEEDTYEIWVEGIQITAQNKDDVLNDGGTVFFSPATETAPAVLTLNGAAIGMSGQATGFVYSDANGIRNEIDGLTIVLKGNNKIGAYSGTDMAAENSEGYDSTIQKFTVDVGVYSPFADVAFAAEENASLTIIDYGAGIQAKNVTFGSDFPGTLKIYDLGGMEPQPPCAITSNGTVTVSGGTFELVSYNSNGISA